MKYIVLKRLVVKRCNAMATPILICPIPLFASAMLGYALGDDLNINISSVMYIHHDAQLLAEDFGTKTLYAHQYRAGHFIDKNDYSKGSKNLSLQPVCNADIEVSLVFGFEDDRTPTIQQIEEAFFNRRLAGGVVHSYDSIHVVNNDFDAVLEMVGDGFVLKDRSDLLQQDNSMTAFVHHTLNSEKNDEQRGWRVATVCGYSQITEPTFKSGVRNNVMHSYVEPMIGLFDLISLRSVTRSTHIDIDTLFFNWSWNGPNFLLQPISHSQENNYV